MPGGSGQTPPPSLLQDRQRTQKPAASTPTGCWEEQRGPFCQLVSSWALSTSHRPPRFTIQSRIVPEPVSGGVPGVEAVVTYTAVNTTGPGGGAGGGGGGGAPGGTGPAAAGGGEAGGGGLPGESTYSTFTVIFDADGSLCTAVFCNDA